MYEVSGSGTECMWVVGEVVKFTRYCCSGGSLVPN
jgi:hypothetical protein